MADTYVLNSQEEFPTLVTQMGEILNKWCNKEEDNLKKAFAELAEEKSKAEEAHAREFEEFRDMVEVSITSIQQDRRAAREEARNAARQITVARDEHRSKLEEESAQTHADVLHGTRRFELERAKAMQEYSAYDKEREKIAAHNTDTETLVEINVGGDIFEAARRTYVSQPASYLARLMSGRAQAGRDRDGRIFLDRDFRLFRSILNFLRDPITPPPSNDAGHSEALATEGNYLGIRFFPYPLLYVLGGCDGKNHFSACELLDVENQCWREAASMSTPRSYFGAEGHLSRLYAYGGQNSEFKALCETELFDCLRGTWFRGPDLNIPRRYLASANLDGRVYAIGGYDGAQILDSVEAYDPRMKNWMPLEKMSKPRSAAAATAFDGKIWVMGGTSGQRRRDGERYDPRMATWENIGDMREERSAEQAVTCLDRLYVLGGMDEYHNYLDSVERYSISNVDRGANMTDTGVWTESKPMLEKLVDFGAAQLNDMIIVAGGTNGSKVFDDTAFFNPSTDDWQKSKELIFPRYGHRLVSLLL